MIGPLGQVTVSVLSDRLQADSLRLTIGKSQSESRLEVEPDCFLSLVLLDGSAEVPYGSDWFRGVQMTSSRGDPEFYPGLHSGPDGQHYSLPGLGTYYLTFPELDGFRPMADATIHVHTGGHHEHRIAVQRQ